MNIVESVSFDLFRLSKSKKAVDLCPNTLRAYNEEGLNFYRRGKVVFISKSELEAFIKTRATMQPSSGHAIAA
jgi:hypothetical protein